MAIIVKHVKGNVLSLSIPLNIVIRTLTEEGWSERVEDFYPNMDYPVRITLKKQNGISKSFEASVDGNIARMRDEGTLPIGLYQVEVTCKDEQGDPYRYMVRSVVEIVDATAEAGVAAGIEFNAQSYMLDAAVYHIAKGDRGMSAYEVAVKNGFVGTEEEWLQSLGFDPKKEYIFDGGRAPIAAQE